MEVVGKFLQTHALSLGSSQDGDYFGRSAFNRYYYATFLLVRAELGGLLPGWPNSHASIPDFLQGTVCKELNKGRMRAERAGDQELSQLCLRAKSAALNLAALLRESYGVRVTADYNPGIPIEFTVGEFSLSTVPAEEARAWAYKGRGFAATIAQAWKQISV